MVPIISIIIIKFISLSYILSIMHASHKLGESFHHLIRRSVQILLVNIN